MFLRIERTVGMQSRLSAKFDSSLLRNTALCTKEWGSAARGCGRQIEGHESFLVTSAIEVMYIQVLKWLWTRSNLLIHIYILKSIEFKNPLIKVFLVKLQILKLYYSFYPRILKYCKFLSILSNENNILKFELFTYLLFLVSFHVHRFGTGGSMRVCHAVGTSFLGEVFRGFSSPVSQTSEALGPKVS